MNDHGDEILGLYPVAPAREPRIAEAEEGVLGGHKALLTVADKFHPRLGGAQVVAVEVAVLIEHLAVLYQGSLALFALYPEFDKACHILTEVKHGLTLGGDDDFFNRQALVRRYPLADAVDKSILGVKYLLSRERLGVGEIRVVDIAVIDARFEIFASLGEP